MHCKKAYVQVIYILFKQNKKTRKSDFLIFSKLVRKSPKFKKSIEGFRQAVGTPTTFCKQRSQPPSALQKCHETFKTKGSLENKGQFGKQEVVWKTRGNFENKGQFGKQEVVWKTRGSLENKG